MATALDASIPITFAPIIAKYGKVVTFRTYPNQTQDDSESTVALGAEVPVVVKVSPPSRAMTTLEGDGSGIEQTVQKFILLTQNGTASAITFTPDIGMAVQFDGNEFLIVKLSPIYSGELIAAYAIYTEV